MAGDAPEPSQQRPTDFDGRPIGPLRLARALTVTTVSGCSIFMTIGVLWPPAQVTIVFLGEQLGASKTLIGLNLSLCTLGMLAALPGAWVFSRLQSRRTIWISLTAASRMFAFGSALVALFANHADWRPTLIGVFIIGLFLVNAGSVFTSPGWWSWMADLIPEAIRGQFLGRRWRWLLLAQSLAAMVACVLLDRAALRRADGDGGQLLRMTYLGVFLVVAATAVIDPLLFWLVPEPARPKPPQHTLRQTVHQYLAPVRDRAFRTLLIGAGLYGFFFNLPLVFFTPFLRGEHFNGVFVGGHASMWLLSLQTVVFGAATAFSANQWGHLADRIGHRIVWILGSLSYLTHGAYFFMNDQNYVWLVLVQSTLWGLLFAGQPMAAQNMVLSMAPVRQREYYISMFQAVSATGAAIGPLLGGWLADHYRVIESIRLPSGQPACYIHLLLAICFVGVLLTLPVMVRIPDAKGVTFLPWFGRLLTGDLLRMAWNIGVLTTTPSAMRHLRALRRIDPKDGNMLLPDITAALEDSDLAIRREALLALGRLGTPEALDLLRWYLHEPDALMRVPSVEAISQTRVPDRSSLLKRALRDPDQRVRRAAVESLGRTGDRDAVGDLRELLTAERDGEVLVSAAVALSRLKEFGAVREMLHLALYSENSTVRSQMLVALADLLSGTSDFNKLWRVDRRWRGKGFARLTSRLRRQARVLVRTHHPAVEISKVTRRRIIAEVDEQVESFLEHVQAEEWAAALDALLHLANQLLRLRYGYRGGDADALEFVSAVAPDQAQRYWQLTYLRHAAHQVAASAAPWDGLTLLAIHSIVHGQPPV